MIKKFDEFLNESVNDKQAFLEILREWGVFNPPEFMNYLNELGYTVVELDPVGSGIKESFETFKLFEDDDEGYEDYMDDEEERLKNWLIRKGVKYPDGFFQELYDEFGITIVKDSEWVRVEDDFVPENESINENKDVRDIIRDKLNPSMFERISKLGITMMDVTTHGLRVNLDLPGDEQYMHVLGYIHDSIKVLNGLIKLEKWTNKKKLDRTLSSEDDKRFQDFVQYVIKEIHYRFPWKFPGYLTHFEQDDLNDLVEKYNELVSIHGGKMLPKKQFN